jgi:hypothetical protein
VETCGPYRIANEIGGAEGSTSYLARGPEGEVMLNVFSAADNEASRKQIELQQTASGLSRHVAPVLQQGTCEDGEWYSTRAYRRSIQKLLEGRVALSKPWVLEILRAITAGALALKKGCGRSHGNLQPYHILLSSSETIKDAEIAIKDPCWDPSTDARGLERRDLKAIGLILYQLVRRREVDQDSIILPLELSVEWKSVFGKEASAWLALCNRLLDQNLSLDSYGLEQLERDLVSLQPKPPVSRQQLVAAGILLFAGVLAALAIAWVKGRATLEITSNLPGANVTLSSNGKILKKFVIQDKAVPVKVRKGAYELVAEYNDLKTNVTAVVSRSVEPVALNFEYGTLQIDAVFVSDGKTNVITSTTLRVKPGGEVRYPIDIKGYRSATARGIVAAGETKRLVEVLEKPAIDDVRVQIETTPSGAVVGIRDPSGQTKTQADERAPITKDLRAGIYTVTARYRGIEKTNRVELIPGKPLTDENRIQFTFETAQLNIVAKDGSQNIPAVITSGGSSPEKWLTTDRPPRWPLGTWTFQVRADGYEQTNVTVVLERDAPITHTVSLRAIVGFVNVTSDPPDVWFGTNQNQRLWRTPTNLALPPANYTFYANHDDLGPTQQLVEVSKARTTAATLKFDYYRVQLESDPAGPEAQVQHPRTKEWRALASLTFLPVATERLEARYPGLLNRTEPLKFGPENHQRPLKVLFNFQYGRLTLASTPELGASVYDTNGVLVGEAWGTNEYKLPYGSRKYKFVGLVEKRLKTNIVEVVISSNGLYQAVTDFRQPTNHKMKANGIELELVFIPTLEYYVGKHEVTQGQYQAITGLNPSPAKLGPNYPVDSVTWQAADAFCKQLNALDTARPPGHNYALPSFEQWSAYVGNAITDINLAVVKSDKPSPVGSKPANDYGLYDVRGNVWEWTQKAEIVGACFKSPGLLRTGNNVKISGSVADETVGFRVILVRDAKLAKN